MLFILSYFNYKIFKFQIQIQCTKHKNLNLNRKTSIKNLKSKTNHCEELTNKINKNKY